MQRNIVRPLDNSELVEPFVKGVLGINGKNAQKAVSKIVSAELQILGVTKAPTATSTKYRNSQYRDDEKREKLKEKILKELISYERLENDDKLKLGKGGAKPHTSVIPGRNIYIIIGLPASGKSYIANKFADKYGAYILDSDYAKRKFPEFKEHVFGANILHEESKEIIWGDPGLLDYCFSNEYNIVFPTIGYDFKRIIKYGEQFSGKNYKVHLVLVSLDRKKAVCRAYDRFLSSKRYVPLGLIFDFYGNEPILTYYRVKRLNEENHYFESFFAISTDVDIEKSPVFIEGVEQDFF